MKKEICQKQPWSEFKQDWHTPPGQRATGSPGAHGARQVCPLGTRSASQSPRRLKGGASQPTCTRASLSSARAAEKWTRLFLSSAGSPEDHIANELLVTKWGDLAEHEAHQRQEMGDRFLMNLNGSVD